MPQRHANNSLNFIFFNLLTALECSQGTSRTHNRQLAAMTIDLQLGTKLHDSR
jgi:hypothetical protein